MKICWNFLYFQIEIVHKTIKKKIKKSNELNLTSDDQIKLGCKNLGLYHAIKPVKLINELIVVKNMKMLYYYRNRLEGYGLKKKLL